MEKLKQNKGITLIALIITIIVMLLLVGVTISVALDGGLFGKAEKASYQTNVSTIKEQLAVAKVTEIAENSGKAKLDYEISIDDLQISESLKKEFKDKLVISKDANLYYNSSKVTAEEIEWLKEIGIKEYTVEPTPPPEPPAEPVSVAGTYANGNIIISDDGTGTFFRDDITYTIDKDLKGTMLRDDEEHNIQFEIKENDVKILYLEIYESSYYPGNERFYNVVYTTNESYAIGELMEDGTYAIDETKELEVIDGNGTLKYKSTRPSENFGKMYVVEDKIYYWSSENYSYTAMYYIINDNTLGDLWG